MRIFRLLLVVCGVSVLVLSCTRQKDTFSGNAEAYSGLRPRDGQYVWFDSRVSCTRDGVTETGYRGVLNVAGSAPIKFRAACAPVGTESIVPLKDLGILEIKEPGLATQNILRFNQGIYDPSADTATPPATGTTRTVARFEAGDVDYEIAVRASGPIEALVDARALITSKAESAGIVTTTLLATIPVTSPTSTTDVRTYTGTDFNLTVTKNPKVKEDGWYPLTATFTGKINGVSSNLTTNDASNTFLVPPAAKIAWKVAAGSNFTCVTDGKEIFCTGGIVASNTYTKIAAPPGNVTVLSAGAFHACAVISYKAYCWGSNSYGQLGTTPTGSPILTATLVSNLPNAVFKIAAGGGHTCATGRANADGSENFSLYCWGDNMHGQVGREASAFALPDIVPGLADQTIAEIALGNKHTCFKPNTNNPGSVQCFGDNSQGQLGNNTTIMGHTPVGVDINTKFVSVYAGGNSSCAITTTGQLHCWGSNTWGVPTAGNHMAHPADIAILRPLNISTYLNANIQKFAMSGVHACAIVSNPENRVMCWGWTDGGATMGPYGGAKAAYIASELPITATNLAYTGIALGASATEDGKMHTILFDDTKFLAQGFNTAGQLGDGTLNNSGQRPAVIVPPK